MIRRFAYTDELGQTHEGQAIYADGKWTLKAKNRFLEDVLRQAIEMTIFYSKTVHAGDRDITIHYPGLPGTQEQAEHLEKALIFEVTGVRCLT